MADSLCEFRRGGRRQLQGPGRYLRNLERAQWRRLSGHAVASTYTALVKKASPAIRAADPTAAILAPALSNTDSTARTWLQSCFQDGLLNYVDAVSVHPYSASTPEAVVPDYAAINSLITQYHPSGSIPIVSSEWGWSTTQVTAQQQGDYLARMFLVNFSQGIPLSCW